MTSNIIFDNNRICIWFEYILIIQKTLVEIIQFGYKSDVRFVSDLRKIGSRISDWKLDLNGSQSEPIRKTIKIQSELIIIPMRGTKSDISESILYNQFYIINFI